MIRASGGASGPKRNLEESKESQALSPDAWRRVRGRRDGGASEFEPAAVDADVVRGSAQEGGGSAMCVGVEATLTPEVWGAFHSLPWGALDKAFTRNTVKKATALGLGSGYMKFKRAFDLSDAQLNALFRLEAAREDGKFVVYTPPAGASRSRGASVSLPTYQLR